MQSGRDQDTFSFIMGQNHLSSEIITRILKPSLVDTQGAFCKGISNMELSSLIYLAKIANEKGLIRDFYITDLADVIQATKRQCYNIITSLSRKGFLTVSEPNWKGTRTLYILNNQLHKKNKRHRHKTFVSLDYAFLDHYDLQHYKNFCNLSLYAKKLLLLILLFYDPSKGYRVNLDTMAERLELKNKYLILLYLKELKSVIGTNAFTIYPNRSARKQFDIVFIHTAVITSVEDARLNVRAMDCPAQGKTEFYPVILNKDYQKYFKESDHAKETYFTYSIRQLIHKIGAVFLPGSKQKCTLMKLSRHYYNEQLTLLAKKVYGVFYGYLKDFHPVDYTFERVEHTLLQVISTCPNFVFSEDIINDLNYELFAL